MGELVPESRWWEHSIRQHTIDERPKVRDGGIDTTKTALSPHQVANYSLK